MRWRAMETMQQFDLPVADQAKFLGGNARRLYRIDPPKNDHSRPRHRDRAAELVADRRRGEGRPRRRRFRHALVAG